MTSSLVGSEMCIRDSPFPYLILYYPYRGWGILPEGFSPPFLDIVRTAVPVSYTHLTLPTICSV
eukprot:9204380-Prorocentrum_lima.AAC.1